jgi:hypothetical protein
VGREVSPITRACQRGTSIISSVDPVPVARATQARGNLESSYRARKLSLSPAGETTQHPPPWNSRSSLAKSYSISSGRRQCKPWPVGSGSPTLQSRSAAKGTGFRHRESTTGRG